MEAKKANLFEWICQYSSKFVNIVLKKRRDKLLKRLWYWLILQPNECHIRHFRLLRKRLLVGFFIFSSGFFIEWIVYYQLPVWMS